MLQLGNAQKQDIGRCLTQAGFDLRDFKWQYRDGQAYGSTESQVPVLVYRDTNFVFAISEDPWVAFLAYWIPAGDRHSALAKCRNWGEVLTWLQRWTLALHQEINAVDPWAALASAAPKQIAPIDVPNAAFTPAERERIGVALDRMRDEIFHLGVADKEQQRVLAAAFADQREKTGRFPRVDWANQFVGWVLGIFTTLALSPEAQQIVGAAATAVMRAAQHGLPLLSH